MKTLILLPLLLVLPLLAGCEAFSENLRVALHQEIDQVFLQGAITEEQRLAAHAAIDAAGQAIDALGKQSISWEGILSLILGSVGSIFGVRATQTNRVLRAALAQRGPPKPLTPEAISTLKKVISQNQGV